MAEQSDIVNPLADYTIIGLGPVDNYEWKKDNGESTPMTKYALQLEDVAHWVYLSQQADKPEPTVGEVIRGHVEKNKYGYTFKRERKGGGAWGGGGKNYAGAAWNAAFQTGAMVASGYFQISADKPESLDDFLAAVEYIATVVKAKVDALGGSAKTEETKPAETPQNEAIVHDAGPVDTAPKDPEAKGAQVSTSDLNTASVKKW